MSSWTYYREEDGLAANGVLDLWQTADGLLWAAGGRGYSQFDGERWMAFNEIGSHEPNVVYDVFESARVGDVWLGFNGGAAEWTGRDWHVVTPLDGLPHQVVHAVWADGLGTVWFACREGLAQRHDGEWSVLYPTENFRSIVGDPNGRLWFGTDDGGALGMANDVWVRHMAGVSVHPVLYDAHGVLWAKSDGDGVYSYTAGQWHHHSTATGFPSDSVYDIYETLDGTLWFATGSGAVSWRGPRQP